jgi:hypothetical protein
MAETWTLIFDGIIENRPVKIESYDEGVAYRVHTTLGADYPGTVKCDGSSTLIMSPVAKGEPITIEGETREEIRNDLVEEGFSNEAASAIVDKLPV